MVAFRTTFEESTPNTWPLAELDTPPPIKVALPPPGGIA
jgi:hypothetical protein